MRKISPDECDDHACNTRCGPFGDVQSLTFALTQGAVLFSQSSVVGIEFSITTFTSFKSVHLESRRTKGWISPDTDKGGSPSTRGSGSFFADKECTYIVRHMCYTHRV
jgi:hypothetical protein